jgi:selenide,water dikinase
VLERILADIKPIADSNVLVGFSTADDAGVYRLTDDLALVQSIDFFTPVVDDAFVYGQIAAANALSDIYAMGARPLFAVSVLGFASDVVDEEELTRVVRGGTEKMNEAGVPVIGGHSIRDREIKFGYAVTGMASPRKLWTNSKASPGDALILTKPLGVGIITTAIKFGKALESQAQRAVSWMLRLNSEVSTRVPADLVHAATDVTGFGLVGHALELGKASNVTLVLWPEAIPVMEGATELAEMGMLPGGARANEAFARNWVDWQGVEDNFKSVLLDPQTSGGLLLSVAREQAEGIIAALSRQGLFLRMIGEVKAREEKVIRFSRD